MKFRLLIILFFIYSCNSNYTINNKNSPFSARGFAYIYSDEDFSNKIIKGRLDESKLQISHYAIKTNSLVQIINPKTKESLILKNQKRILFPDFYKIMMTSQVANKLKIDKDFPFVEILEIKRNKSFVAEKAKIFKEEKQISSNAPVTSVKISNISKNKNMASKTKKKENIFIVIATFYSEETAKFLKERIIHQISEYDPLKLKIVKKSNKEISLISGPYNTINLVKNDYTQLKEFGFEELNLTIND